MSFDGGWQGYLLILGIALVAHESWRWLGAFLGRNVTQDDAVFVWVRYVSMAIVAALVTRLILFPAGELEAISLPVRVASVAIGIALFLGFRRNLAIGIAGGSLALVLLAQFARNGGG